MGLATGGFRAPAPPRPVPRWRPRYSTSTASRGVSRRDFVTVTKTDAVAWETLKPQVLGHDHDHFVMEAAVIDSHHGGTSDRVRRGRRRSGGRAEIAEQIKELLDTRVRPAVAGDGGDIVLPRVPAMVWWRLHMQGSCSGLPHHTRANTEAGIEKCLRHIRARGRGGRAGGILSDPRCLTRGHRGIMTPRSHCWSG